jgi:hypothetical protein
MTLVHYFLFGDVTIGEAKLVVLMVFVLPVQLIDHYSEIFF